MGQLVTDYKLSIKHKNKDTEEVNYDLYLMVNGSERKADFILIDKSLADIEYKFKNKMIDILNTIYSDHIKNEIVGYPRLKFRLKLNYPEKDRILIELISIADGKIGHLDLFMKLPNYINIIKCNVISKQISNIELPSNVVLCIMCRTNAILYNTENIRAIIGIDTYANVVRSVIARNEKEIVFNNLEGIVMNDEYIQANEIESIIFKDECTLNRIPYSAIKYLRNLKLIKVSPSIRWIDSMKIKNIIHIDSAGNKYIRIENKTIGITE